MDLAANQLAATPELQQAALAAAQEFVHRRSVWLDNARYAQEYNRRNQGNYVSRDCWVHGGGNSKF